MIVSAHQPNFLPWLGFFGKVQLSDLCVLLDDVQYSRGSLTNRVKVAGTDPPGWLTVPVRKGSHQALIGEIRIDYSKDWVTHQMRSLQTRYGGCEYFSIFRTHVFPLLQERFDRLVDLNVRLIRELLQVVGIGTPLVLSSELGAVGQKSCLIIDLCRRAGATAYLAGQGAAAYDDLAMYRARGLEYRRLVFDHPVYAQRGAKEFCAGLSAIDALANVGPEETRRMLTAHAGHDVPEAGRSADLHDAGTRTGPAAVPGTPV